MPSALLLKAPAESRTYTFDFTGTMPPSERRGTVWSEALLRDGQSISTPVVTVTRDDGIASDLTIGAPATDGETVTVQISGGTTGHQYAVTSACAVAGGVVWMQGVLVVSGDL